MKEINDFLRMRTLKKNLEPEYNIVLEPKRKLLFMIKYAFKRKNTKNQLQFFKNYQNTKMAAENRELNFKS